MKPARPGQKENSGASRLFYCYDGVRPCGFVHGQLAFTPDTPASLAGPDDVNHRFIPLIQDCLLGDLPDQAPGVPSLFSPPADEKRTFLSGFRQGRGNVLQSGNKQPVWYTTREIFCHPPVPRQPAPLPGACRRVCPENPA